ncbi:MAG: ribosome biogenesis GTPase YlqF [Thermacetogeniaceae bacterium]
MNNRSGILLALGPKKKELILKALKVVDIVFEIIDARCPESSRSPAIEQLVKNKRRFLVLNKADLADPDATARWLKYYRKAGVTVAAVDSQRGEGFEELWKDLEIYEEEIRHQLLKKGRRERELRAAVVGIPNTGKSSFLNRLVGRKTTATGDRPGITKGPQWVHSKGRISVLDTPGVLPPSVKREELFKLVLIGAVDYDSCDLVECGEKILEFLKERYPESIQKALGISELQALNLAVVAEAKNFLLPEGTPDLNRTAVFLLKQLRLGRLGRITYELPSLE